MAEVVPGLAYKIISSANQLVLDVEGGDIRDRARVLLYKWGGRANQVWEAEKIRDNVFILHTAAGNSFVLDSSERTEEDGQILIFSKHGKDNQQWKVEPIQPGAFDCYIENVRNGKVLQLTQKGRGITLATKNVSQVNQRWLFSEA